MCLIYWHVVWNVGGRVCACVCVCVCGAGRGGAEYRRNSVGGNEIKMMMIMIIIMMMARIMMMLMMIKMMVGEEKQQDQTQHEIMKIFFSEVSIFSFDFCSAVTQDLD